MGIANAVYQFETIINNVSGHTNADIKVTNLAELDPPGIDKKFLVRVTSRVMPGLTSSNIRNEHVKLSVQLSRELSGGKNYNLRTIQDEIQLAAFNCTVSLETPSNWDYTNTEIVLVNAGEENTAVSESGKSVIWEQEYEVFIRHII